MSRQPITNHLRPMVVRIRLARFGRKVRWWRTQLQAAAAHASPHSRRPPPLRTHPGAAGCGQPLDSPLLAPKLMLLAPNASLQNLPFYRIFVADSRCPRDGRHLEQVGHYDPIPGRCY